MRRNLTTGLVTMAALALLGITGILLYYGGEEWRDAVRWAHNGIGTLAVPAHVVFGRRDAARSISMRARTVDSDTEAVRTTGARRTG